MARYGDTKDADVIVHSTGSQSSKNMSVSTKDDALLFMVMVDKLYSNPIGSLLREYVSNAYDAQVEYGETDHPINVTLKEDEEGEALVSIEDFGIGISPERAMVMSNLLDSTKRQSDDQHGFFGLGSKSGLAYSNIVELHTTHDGMYYLYFMQRNSKGASFDLITSRELDVNDKQHGSKIVIPVEQSDFNKFLTEIQLQLGYFDNVIFDVPGFDNEYTIFDGNYFRFNTLYTENHSQAHIVLGKVRYRIDWNALGITPIDFPIGFKFDIGELLVTPSREDIQYLDDTASLIIDRISDAIQELIELALDGLEPYENVYDYLLNYDQDREYCIEEIRLNVPLSFLASTSFLSDEDKNRIKEAKTIKNYPHRLPNIGIDEPIKEFYISKVVKKGKAYTPEHSEHPTIRMLHNNRCVLMDNDATFNARKNAYISEHVLYEDTFYLIKRTKKKGIRTLRNYKNILNLRKYAKSSWRDRIEAWQKYFTNLSFVLYKDVKVPDDFNKASFINYSALRKAQGKVLVKYLRRAEKGGDYMFDKDEFTYAELMSLGFTIYGTDNDQDFFKYHYTRWYNVPRINSYSYNINSRKESILENRKKAAINVMTVPASKIDAFKDLPNFHTFDEIMRTNLLFSDTLDMDDLMTKKAVEGSKKVLRRIASEHMILYLVVRFMNEYNNTTVDSHYVLKDAIGDFNQMVRRAFEFIPDKKLFISEKIPAFKVITNGLGDSLSKYYNKFLNSSQHGTNFYVILEAVVSSAFETGNFDRNVVKDFKNDLVILKELTILRTIIPNTEVRNSKEHYSHFMSRYFAKKNIRFQAEHYRQSTHK